jgi:hypothetical protein
MEDCPMTSTSARVMSFALLLTLASASIAQAPSADAWRGARPAVHLELEPGTDDGRYLATATVTDLRNGAVLATPSLEVTAGAPAAVELGTAGETSMRIEIMVDSTGTRATWSFELRDKDGPLTRQHAILTLSRPREASY